jgi:Fe-S-cluster containining protein
MAHAPDRDEAQAKRRILELMTELSKPDHVSGRRAFPRTLDPADAMFIAGKLQEAVDEGCEVRARKIAEDGMKLACGPGCNYCCEQPILVWLPEAMRVAAWLERPENAAAREAFLEAYPVWRDRIEADVQRVGESTATGDRLATLRVFLAAFQKRVLCAFNRDGKCTIYPVRPIVCRHHHALETSAHCNADDEGEERRGFVAFKPLDDFVERARRLNLSMHNALGAPKQQTLPLCTTVHELLTARKPGGR